MPTKHARCSASAAYRWINCPGSVALSDQCPDPGTSSYADEGTLAHSLAELKLRHALKELTTGQYKKQLAKIQQSDYYNAEMDEATDFYVDAVLEEFAAADEGAELMIEQQLSLEQWIPEGFGTSDVVIVSNTQIQVIDLKYGEGIKVEAKNNPQLRLYGLGAAVLFGSVYDFDTVKATVKLHKLCQADGNESAIKIVKGEVGEVITSGAADWVKTGENPPGTTLLHSHTNDTPFSAVDLRHLLNPNVEKIGVVSYNGDAWMAYVGGGWVPTVEEFDTALKSINSEIDRDVYAGYDGDTVSENDLLYMAIREQFFRVCRHFKWTAEGGYLYE